MRCKDDLVHIEEQQDSDHNLITYDEEPIHYAAWTDTQLTLNNGLVKRVISLP
ncbi:MAG: hypothetical protein H7X86_04945, partial [Gorillibacterium sp.]|nr:hypothetical protein [Gorillibacterium sp.]